MHSEMYTVTCSAAATDEANAEADPVPIVLMHGFGAGVAVWCGNIKQLAERHTVHAFDLLGKEFSRNLSLMV